MFDRIWVDGFWADGFWAEGLWIGEGAAAASRIGGRTRSRPIYIVELPNGTEVLVQSAEQARKILEANRPKLQVLPPVDPLPKVSITKPGDRPPGVALPRAQSGVRGLG